ncbi:FAD-dependent monooxygenase [Marinomonas sp. THO17]|uniref:FAD-dependent monooxygenase n=1 Tax=Marinomonas sp. THO17 TaxID=3149048 RepID=UPI00336C066C
MHVVIVGAGIGGLTLASALRGCDVTIIEQRPVAEGIGAGLMLHDEALDALRSVEVDIVGQKFSEFRLGLSGGREIRSIARSGQAVTRSALHSELLNAASHASLRTSTTVKKFKESAEGVCVWLSDGDKVNADFLVGADGLGSSIRKLLGSNARRRYSGETCWRGLSDLHSGQRNPIEIWGKGRRVGIVPLLSGTYIYLTHAVPAGAPRTPAPTDEFLQPGFGVENLIQSVPEDAWIQHDLDELSNHTWGTHRVPLLGDAAHGFTPNLGEGAAQAILDAIYLAGNISGVWQYPGPRYRRNVRIATMSRWVGRVGQANGVWASVRDNMLSVLARRPL